MGDLISRLSEIRSEYNCFDENEEPYYRALSEAIKILSRRSDKDTISRRAAIDFIDAGHLCNPNEPRWSDNDVVNFLKSRPSTQQWIPCSERLPEESGEYLVTCLHHSGELWIEVDRFDKNGGNSPYQWWRFDEKVIAWMPLPEPYKQA